MTPDPGFVCPRCRGVLAAEPDAWLCAACAVRYPIVAGIPDFRVAPDPWIGLEEDRAKAVRVERAAAGLDFEGAVRAYWELTPSTPSAQAERFIHHVLHARDRTAQWLASLGGDADAAHGDGWWLDAGCGTADLAAAAGPRARVVGIDVALRWLVVARRRLEEERVPIRLVAANAERMPFPDRAFDRVFSLGMVEHCADSAAFFEEAHRVLRPDGVIRLRTANRFSLLPEPHVGVWGVGFLPRSWADPYVRWRNGERYLHHHPDDARGLRRMLRRSGFRNVRVEAAPMLAAEIGRQSPAAQRLGAWYERARSTPLVRPLLSVISPLLEGRGVAA